MVKTHKRKPPIPENHPIKIRLSALKRNIIWDALYGARAQGRNSGKPDWEKARELIMDSMRIISTHKVNALNQMFVEKALPEDASVTVILSGLKRNVIWDALYGARVKGRNDDKPNWYKAREEIMDSMRII